MNQFLDVNIIEISGNTITVGNAISIVVILIVGVIIQRIVKSYIERKLGEKGGRTKSIVQLTSYVIMLITALFAMQYVGIDITVFIASLTALSFGIGFGLQQTFADFFSGLILLFDRSIAVGDGIELEEEIYKVKKIGLRTSLVESVQDNTLIIPNSLITSTKVDNFSYNNTPSTFNVTVGVSYSSDIDKVEKILIDCLKGIDGVIRDSGRVRLDEFGESSVNFKLLFDTKRYMEVYRIRSDIRKNIFKNFEKDDIEIPFPQRVVHMEKEGPSEKNV